MDAMLRSVRDADWPGIFRLANESVAHVAGAGSQEVWYHNRRYFDSQGGVQHQFVVQEPATQQLLGYGAVECNLRSEFRLFIVTTSERLNTVGMLLYERGLAILRQLHARQVWFTEYVADEPLLQFARSRGFMEIRRFSLADGCEAITLVKELPG
jgi:hypothetical protein